MGSLFEAAIFLAAAVVAVPLFRRFGFGSVLGYLAAGVVIGPWGLGLIGAVGSVLHFAEIGVVLLLFVIGLELQPSRLWVLRRAIFGLGGAQVVVTTLVLSAIAWLLGLAPWPAAIVGFGLSLSSTAFVLQLLAERKQLTTQQGRAGFAVLLFQDLAAIPVLAALPLLVSQPGAGDSAWLDTGLAIAAIVGLVVGGRLLLRPVFRYVAGSASHEIFTAAALLVVIASALLLAGVGLSMALGAFLAGVLLADSEFRHELEATIDPFKGLLLGLFFMAVGMSANLGLLRESPLLVLGLVIGLIAVKAALLYAAARAFGLDTRAARAVGLTLSQGGEFAFVVFGSAVGHGLLDARSADLAIVAVTLSMAATPLLWLLDERVFCQLGEAADPRPFDAVPDQGHAVVIAGFGRFGQIVARLLRLMKVPFTALESSPAQVDFVRRFGSQIYYGDASRLDLLRAAHVEKASIFVLAIDEMEASLRTAELVRKHFPAVAIYARARNRRHAHLLMDLGVKVIERETFGSSLELAQRVLEGLGVAPERAAKAAATFRDHDEAALARQFAVFRDEQKLIQSVKETALELEALFEEDAKDPPPDGGGPG